MMDCNAKNKSILTNIESLETNKNLEVSNVREYYLLPKKMSPNKKIFEKVGFKFEKINNKNMIKVYIPNNWHIEKENGILRYFYDDKQRLRGEILSPYQSLYCNFKGEICLRKRFNINYKYNKKNDINSTVTVFIEEYNGKIFYKLGECRNAYDCKEFEELKKKAKKYLDKNYPDWENPISYWD